MLVDLTEIKSFFQQEQNLERAKFTPLLHILKRIGLINIILHTQLYYICNKLGFNSSFSSLHCIIWYVVMGINKAEATTSLYHTQCFFFTYMWFFF